MGLSKWFCCHTHWTLIESLLPPIQCQQSPIWGEVKGNILFRWTVCRLRRCSLQWELKVHSLKTKGGPSLQRKSCPSPWLVHFDANEKSNLHGLICPYDTVLIGWNWVFLLVVVEMLWLVSKDTKEDIAVQFWLDRTGPVYTHW